MALSPHQPPGKSTHAGLHYQQIMIMRPLEMRRYTSVPNVNAGTKEYHSIYGYPARTLGMGLVDEL
jgi:hypothetical protein